MCRYTLHATYRNTSRVRAPAPTCRVVDGPGRIAHGHCPHSGRGAGFAVSVESPSPATRRLGRGAPSGPCAAAKRSPRASIGDLAPGRGYVPWLAQRPVDGPSGGHADSAPLWNRLPPRSCAQDPQTALELEQPKTRISRSRARRSSHRALGPNHGPALKKNRLKKPTPIWSSPTSRASSSRPPAGAPLRRGVIPPFIPPTTDTTASRPSVPLRSVPNAINPISFSSCCPTTKMSPVQTWWPSYASYAAISPDLLSCSWMAPHPTAPRSSRSMWTNNPSCKSNPYRPMRLNSIPMKESGATPSMVAWPTGPLPIQRPYGNALPPSWSGCGIYPIF